MLYLETEISLRDATTFLDVFAGWLLIAVMLGYIITLIMIVLFSSMSSNYKIYISLILLCFMLGSIFLVLLYFHLLSSTFILSVSVVYIIGYLICLFRERRKNKQTDMSAQKMIEVHQAKNEEILEEIWKRGIERNERRHRQLAKEKEEKEASGYYKWDALATEIESAWTGNDNNK